MKRFISLPVPAITIVFALLSIILFTGDLPAKILNRVIVRINEEVVLESEVDDKLIASIGKENVKKLEEEAPDKLLQYKKELVEQIITERIVLQEAEVKNVNVTAKEIAEGINTLKADLSDEDFEMKMKLEGISIEELEKSVKDQLTARKLLEMMVTAEVVKPTQDDIEVYLKENLEDIQNEIGRIVYNNRIEEFKEKWLGKLREKASIIKNDFK